MGEISHLSVWHSFKQGDWNAYTLLYNTYFDPLNNYGYKFCRDADLIEDTIHDLFVRLWTTKEKLSNPVSVKNYVFKAFRNILFRKMKNEGKFTGISADEYPFGFEVSYSGEILARIEDRETQEKVKAIIKTLPPRQQEIIFLRFYEGLSYEEIADIMAISISSTYKLFYKAISNLQNTISSSSLLTVFFYLKSFPGFFSS